MILILGIFAIDSWTNGCFNFVFLIKTTAFWANKGWYVSEVLLYPCCFDSRWKDQQARDSHVPNHYKVILITLISVSLCMFCMHVIWIEVKLVGYRCVFCCYPHFNAKKLIGFTDLVFSIQWKWTICSISSVHHFMQ